MTKTQSWALAAVGVIALAMGALLATMGGGSAQTATPTPAPTTASSADDGTDDSSTDDSTETVRPFGGHRHYGLYGVKEAAAEILGMTEDELQAAREEGQTLAEIAAAQGMAVEDFEAALVTAVTADLQAELDAGDITQEEFDEVTTDLAERIDEIVNREPGEGRIGGGCQLGVQEAAAEKLGLTEDELHAALEEGQTLAEVAVAQGMTVEDFEAALVTTVTADLQAQLDAGEITQEEFDERTSDLAERIDDIVNREPGAHGFRGAPTAPRAARGSSPGSWTVSRAPARRRRALREKGPITRPLLFACRAIRETWLPGVASRCGGPPLRSAPVGMTEGALRSGRDDSKRGD